MNPLEPTPQPALTIDCLRLTAWDGDRLPPVSFELGAGQIGAVLGLAGTGKTRLARALAGLDPAAGGGFHTPDGVTWFDADQARPAGGLTARALLSDLDTLDRTCLLDSLGLTAWQDCPAERLPGSLRHSLGLARALQPALSGTSGLLVLDDLPGLEEHAPRLAAWLPDALHAGPSSLLFTTRSPAAALLLADRVLVLRRAAPPACWPEDRGPGAPGPAEWQVRLAGQLDPARAAWFPGLRLETEGAGTRLTGALPDPAALHGLLTKIRDLGLEIVSLARTDPTAENILRGWMEEF